jgi:hypothetical protein
MSSRYFTMGIEMNPIWVEVKLQEAKLIMVTGSYFEEY